MFSQVSVILFTGGRVGPDRGKGIGAIPTPWAWDLYPTPTVLTSRGGHKITYGWQVGSTHPTGMLSCFMLFNFKLNLFAVL